MTQLTFAEIDRTVLDTLRPAKGSYWFAVVLLFLGILTGAACWAYQIFVGIGVAGMNIPVAWGTYLINFVFWVGIAHSGTLISAILHLFRAGWRNPIARAAETMTVFAVCTAGLFPFIHLGRAHPESTRVVAQFPVAPDVRRRCHQYLPDGQFALLVHRHVARPGEGARQRRRIP
jgi:molybdopterin-containing oxidoreductase family membrane subunit